MKKIILSVAFSLASTVAFANAQYSLVIADKSILPQQETVRTLTDKFGTPSSKQKQTYYWNIGGSKIQASFKANKLDSIQAIGESDAPWSYITDYKRKLGNRDTFIWTLTEDIDYYCTNGITQAVSKGPVNLKVYTEGAGGSMFVGFHEKHALPWIQLSKDHPNLVGWENKPVFGSKCGYGSIRK